MRQDQTSEQFLESRITTPICPCCKRPNAAVREQVVQANRLVTMWQCQECRASWGYRRGRKAS